MFRVFLLLLRPLLLVEEPHGGRERGGSVGGGALYTATEHQGKRLAITGSRVQQPESACGFSWPVVISCALGCPLLRSTVPDMVREVCAQSFPSPLFKPAVVYVLLTWAVNKSTSSRMFCINVHHRISAAIVQNYARARGRPSTMFRASSVLFFSCSAHLHL